MNRYSRTIQGHANFLDVLIEQFDPDNEKPEAEAVKSPPPVKTDIIKEQYEEFEDLSDTDSDTDSDEEEWSDESDDEGHILARVFSHPVLGRQDNEAYDEFKTSPSEDGNDYFQLAGHGEALQAMRLEVSAALQESDIEKDSGVSVVVTNFAETPMASPTAEQVVEDVDLG